MLQEYYYILRNDFWLFCLYWDDEFFNKRPFLEDVAVKMQSIADKKTRRLSISMPPRAGKSYIASLFSAWMLGRNPEGSVMRNSCTETLALTFSYHVRDMIKDARFREIFHVGLSPDRAAVKGWNLETSKSVGYFCGGTTTTIAGFGATVVAILDDPIKDVFEALSENVLDKKWDWYTGVHSARMEKDCPEIHISTRWSRRDPIGRLEGDFDDVIIVPALDGEDKSFCEDVKSTEDYHRLRNLTAEFIWNAEFQQKPIEATGLLYTRDTLNIFDIDNLKGDGEIVAAVDVADKGDDYLACVIAKVMDNDAWIIDVVFTQDPIEITEGLVAQAMITHNVSMCRVESNSGGRSFANNIERIIREEGCMTSIEAHPTTKNKETRMNMRSSIVREFVHFRDDEKMDRHYKMFMQQLCSTFRKVASNKHDDAADVVTMLADLISDKTESWVL